MKLFTVVCIASMMVVSVVNAQTSLGLRGGFVSTNLQGSPAGNKGSQAKTSSFGSWQAGIYLNIPLFEQGYLQPGLNYITKGANLEYVSAQPANVFLSGATQIKLQYLELPVNFIYKIPLSFGKIALGGGPYAAYSIRGDYNLAVYNEGKLLQTSSQRLDFKQDPNIFSTGMNIHRWDAGLNFTAGVELNCFVTLGVNYSLGLMDIDKSGSSMKNRCFGVSLGLLLNREDW